MAKKLFAIIVALSLAVSMVAPAASIVIPATASNMYSIIYLKEGATGGEPPFIEEYSPGEPVTIRGNSGSAPLVKEGHVLVGWARERVPITIEAAYSSSDKEPYTLKPYVLGDTIRGTGEPGFNFFIRIDPGPAHSELPPILFTPFFPPYNGTEPINSDGTWAYTPDGYYLDMRYMDGQCTAIYSPDNDYSPVTYVIGDTFEMLNSDISLYPIWAEAPVQHTVTFTPVGGTFADNSSDPFCIKVDHGDRIGEDRMPPDPILDGNNFYQWIAGNNIIINANTIVTEDIDAISFWIAKTYKVVFHPNAGTGTVTGNMADQKLTFNVIAALNSNMFVRTGYIFKGWATSPAGVVHYDDGQIVMNMTYVGGDTVNLYACWEPIKYTVIFLPSLGYEPSPGTMVEQYFEYDEEKPLRKNEFSWPGYAFRAWSTTSDINERYMDEQLVKNLTDIDGAVVIMYAIIGSLTYDAPMLIVGSAVAGPGNKVTIPITASGVPQLASLRFRVNSPNNAMKLTGITLPDGSGFTAAFGSTPGSELISFVPKGTSTVNPNGILLYLNFEISYDAQAWPLGYSIDLSDLRAVDEYDSTIPLEVTPGRLTVFRFGDFTGNREVDGNDILWINRYINCNHDLEFMKTIWPPALNTFCEPAADFTNNGEVDGTDVLWIHRYITEDSDPGEMVKHWPTLIDFSHLGVINTPLFLAGDGFNIDSVDKSLSVPLGKTSSAAVIGSGSTDIIKSITPDKASITDVIGPGSTDIIKFVMPDKTSDTDVIGSSSTGNTLSMMPDRITAAKGETVTVMFRLDVAPHIEISSLWLTLDYDTEFLRLIPSEIKFPGALSTVSTGPFYFTFAPKGPAAQLSGDVFSLTFEILDDSSEAIIGLKINRARTPDDLEANISAPAAVAINHHYVEVTSLRITPAQYPAAPVLVVSRNSTAQFDICVNEGASTSGIKWMVSNTVFASVDEKTGLVTIFNKTGSVVLIASAENGITHSVILRITA